MVADDPNDQTATEAAFELLHTFLRLRLSRRRLSVVDATNVEGWARERLLSDRAPAPGGRPCHRLRPPVAVCLAPQCLQRDRATCQQPPSGASIGG